jgi:hypothetical protein
MDRINFKPVDRGSAATFVASPSTGLDLARIQAAIIEEYYDADAHDLFFDWDTAVDAAALPPNSALAADFAHFSDYRFADQPVMVFPLEIEGASIYALTYMTRDLGDSVVKLYNTRGELLSTGTDTWNGRGFVFDTP